VRSLQVRSRTGRVLSPPPHLQAPHTRRHPTVCSSTPPHPPPSRMAGLGRRVVYLGRRTSGYRHRRRSPRARPTSLPAAAGAPAGGGSRERKPCKAPARSGRRPRRPPPPGRGRGGPLVRSRQRAAPRLRLPGLSAATSSLLCPTTTTPTPTPHSNHLMWPPPQGSFPTRPARCASSWARRWPSTTGAHSTHRSMVEGYTDYPASHVDGFCWRGLRGRCVPCCPAHARAAGFLQPASAPAQEGGAALAPPYTARRVFLLLCDAASPATSLVAPSLRPEEIDALQAEA